MKERISRFIVWYKNARQHGEMQFWWIFLVAVYTPFEDFLVKWIPGPSLIPAVLHFIPEIILYSLFINLLFRRLPQRQFQKTPIDELVVIFFISALISIIVNGSPLFESIYNIRTLWRYISAYYVLVNTNISPQQVSLMLSGIKLTGIIESIIVFFQFFLPTSINQFLFAPRQLEIAGYQKQSQAEDGSFKPGSIFGTFDNTAVLSTFLLLTSVLVWNFIYAKSSRIIPENQDFISLFFLYFATFASKKRIALVISLVIAVIVLWYRQRKIQASWVIWTYTTVSFVAIAGMLLFTSPQASSPPTSVQSEAKANQGSPPEETSNASAYFLKIFSPEFLGDSKENSRIWIASTTLNAIVDSGSWFGFGPDLITAKKSMIDFIPDPKDQNRMIRFIPYEDFYWIAMIAYYGVIGLGIYLLILYRLYQVSRWLMLHSSVPEYKLLATTFCTLSVVTILYAFVERILILRTFSLYFWVLAGLVVNARYHNPTLREHGNR